MSAPNTSSNELWAKRRVQLQDAVANAILDLFEHTNGAANFSFPLSGTNGLRVEVKTVSAHETKLSQPTYADLQRGANALWERQFKDTPWEGKVGLIRPDSMEEYRALALQVWKAVSGTAHCQKHGVTYDNITIGCPRCSAENGKPQS